MATVDINNYPGSKTNLIPQLMNYIPDCKIFVDLFCGSAVVGKSIYDARPDIAVILNDINTGVFANLATLPCGAVVLNYDYRHVMVILELFVSLGFVRRNDVFIYADPPYVKSSRRSTVDIYAHEFSDSDHAQLISSLLQAEFNCMISGYPSELYNDLLKQWHRAQFKVSTRAGVAIEVIWMNYNIGDLDLATYKFYGLNRTDRQRVKRKRDRLINKLKELPKHERHLIIKSIQPL